jgi:hypothetical protein
LTTLDGLQALVTIDGGLTVSSNDALTSILELSAVTTVTGQLDVHDNPQLCDDQVDTILAQLTASPSFVTHATNWGACP